MLRTVNTPALKNRQEAPGQTRRVVAMARPLAIAVAAAALLVLGALAVVRNGDGATRLARSAGAKDGVAASRRVTVSAVGDITLGRDGVTPPGGAAWLLASTRRSLGADIAVGNLETTLGSGTGSKCAAGSSNCFAFGAPASYAVALRKLGFDLVNVANNHANDAGPSGQRVTHAALARAGLRFTGTPGRIAYVRRRGVRVAFIGFAPYPWAQSLLNIPDAQRIVRRAATRADVVVVMVHAGAEGADREHVRPGMETYLGELRGDAYRFAHAVVTAGADLVLGSGPHVLRGLEWYRGRLIAYSLGNFSGWHTLSTAGELGVSAVLHVQLDVSGRAVGGRIVPLRLDGDGRPGVDPQRAAWPLLRRLSRGDFGARGASIRADGSVAVPRARRVTPR
jgi:poly-gamma-glutamate capsule biosynthesis protein CapA/YwtB (metallophosphatase superfamily)